ncbi:MAG: 3-dehydroquinate synthase [Proteobacteria bacterium]|nr:3-dehydroquinate synthase [Desulfobulbaceae bacterium]MBU4152332.1 3-dehydroquinate synthase [Pseudomonadota bacterium]
MKQVQVGLGDRSYPIMIDHGLLATIGSDLKTRNIAKRFVVIADDTVAGLYGERLLHSLQASGFVPDIIAFPAGEASKTMATVAHLASRLAQLGVDRKDGLIALGGGVTGDITGFLAASYLRGIPFVQIPTTLLAQVDSSVGGKTGVDIPEGKNLIGAFHQPRAVYIDSQVLQTLPAAELLNGIAEVIKYGVIYDYNFFVFLENQLDSILKYNLPILEEVIETCCTIKAEVVSKDEREADLRRILNFGHTIGHAVEADSGYQLSHGSAVAIGMVAASSLAVAKGMLPVNDAARLTALIKNFGLPTTIPTTSDRQKLKSYLLTDKKTVAGRPFFVLPTSIGTVTITADVNESLLDQVLK